MKIFFSVGEPSGDLHGSNLIRQLKSLNPEVECVGYGGPKMAAAGCKLHTDLTEFAVMMLGRVLLHLPKFWNLASEADRYFRHHKPDAVVMIDYPGFNWWIARRAKAHGIPVFYYGVPQLWAWASWRVKKMRRLVDHALCKLPFEEPWFRERGVNAKYVGHPFFDQLRNQQLDEPFIAQQKARPQQLVTILPGSRTQEVENNLKWLLKSAARIHKQVPSSRFAIAAFREKHLPMIQSQIGKYPTLPVEVHVGRTQELMVSAHSCLACSGSVSLELLYHTKPSVILYYMNQMVYRVCERLVKVPYMTLVNLLIADDITPPNPRPYDPNGPDAAKVLFPEYPTFADKSEQLASDIVSLLTNKEKYDNVVARLSKLKAQVDQGGASKQAAAYITQQLESRRMKPLKPHFVPALATNSSPAGLKNPARGRAA